MSRSYTMLLIATALLVACAHPRTAIRAAAPGPIGFPTPQAAVAALVEACRTNDAARVEAIFGETNRELVLAGDEAADSEHCRRFVRAADAMTRLDPWGERRLVLVVGTDDFAFPVPLVERGERWQFDPEAGAAEVLRRRAGENELGAIGTCRSWAHQDHRSAAGLDTSQAFRGYYYEELSPENGGHGTALLAWPAEYRVTGVQSFLVGPDGVVLEKDLGRDGAQAITTYAPDDTWHVVRSD